MSLKGKVAFITGASSGIGQGIARVFAQEGAKVVVAARRLERLEALKSELEKSVSGCQVLPVQLDVRDKAAFKAAVELAIKTFGQVDILVNNAGVMLLSWARNMHEDEWEEMVDINIKGVLNGVGAVLPHMRERKVGDIVNISSDADRKTFPGSAVYSGTKAFVTIYSTGLRNELAEEKLPIRVTTLSPGATESDLAMRITDSTLPPWTPIKMVTADETARIILFVVSQPAHISFHNLMYRPTDQSS